MTIYDQDFDVVDPYAPLGLCYVCGAAAWTTAECGLLCPSHENALDDYQHEYKSLSAKATKMNIYINEIGTSDTYRIWTLDSSVDTTVKSLRNVASFLLNSQPYTIVTDEITRSLLRIAYGIKE